MRLFQVVLQDSTENKILFSRLLTNSLCGVFSLEAATQPHGQRDATLTSFTYRVFVDLVLASEPVTVILQSPSPTATDALPISLPLTYTSASFHPSLPVSQRAHLTSLPLTTSLSHLSTLCHTHTPTSSNRAKVTSTKHPTLPTTNPGAHTLKKKLLALSTYGAHTSNKTEPKPILKPVSQSPHFSFSLSSGGPRLPPHTKLSELVTTIATPHCVLPLTVHTSQSGSGADSKRDGVSPSSHTPSSSSPPSLLETFAGNGGLVLLSYCLPSLYPHLWPPTPPPHHSEEEEEEEDGESSHTGNKSSRVAQHSVTLSSAQDTPLPHSLVTLGLCLRLHCYGDALMEHPSVACTLLKMLMRVEFKGQCAHYPLEC